MTDSTAKAPQVDYVDLPDVPETFADSIHSIFFDGQTLRINFCVTRLSEVHQAGAQKGKRHPVCRLVLSPHAAVDLMNKMQQTSAALVKAGILKAELGTGLPGGKTN